MRDPDWQEVSTGTVEVGDEAAECSVYASTPDSACCGADLGSTDDVLLCAECGAHCGYSGYRWRPDCRGVVTDILRDAPPDGDRIIVEVERDEGGSVKAETSTPMLIDAAASLSPDVLVGEPVGLEPEAGDAAGWHICFLDGIDYEGPHRG